MAEAKLSAPVGQAPRTSPGAKIANKKTDVMLVQKMLKANGFPTPIDGKMNAGLIKAIGAAEKRLAGEKTPTLVVDPGGKLVKALLPKHRAAEKKAAEDPFYRLPAMNIVVPKSEFDKSKEKVLKDLAAIHKILAKSFAYSRQIHLDCLRAGAAEEGLLKAISVAIVVTVGQIKMPSQDLMRKAESSIDNLRRCIGAKDLNAINNAMFEADRTLTNYDKDLYRYLSKISRTSWYVGTSLNVTTCAGWIVVGAMATPILVTAGAGTAGAMALSGSGVAVMQSAVNEIGGYSTGTQKSVFNAAYNIMMDGAVGGVAGVIGGALPEPFKKTLGKYLGAKVAAQVGPLAKDKAEAVIIEWLSHAGAEVAAEALSSAVKLVGATAKSGKAPTQKEFEAACGDILFKLMGANFLKMLGGLETKAATASRGILTDKMLPEWFNKFAKGEVPPEVRKKIMTTVVSKLDEQAAKMAFDHGVSNLKGNPTANKMAAEGAKKLAKDKALEKAVDREMRAAMKKHKCMVK